MNLKQTLNTQNAPNKLIKYPRIQDSKQKEANKIVTYP